MFPREFPFCHFINYITYIRMWVNVHKTTVERNGSLGYHHVVCNRKTKHARQKALLENSRGRFAFKKCEDHTHSDNRGYVSRKIWNGTVSRYVQPTFRNLWAIFAPSNSYYTGKTSLASLHCNTLTMTNIFTLKTVVLVIDVLAQLYPTQSDNGKSS